MRAQRSRILRLTGRNIASKSPVLASGATEADPVTRHHSHAGIHARGERVAADRAVKVLVGAKALHHVDLHVENRPAVRGAVRDRFGTESKSALGTSR